MVTYKKISAMTAATALAGTEPFAVVQSSATKKATPAQMATYVHANPTAGTANTAAIIGEFQFTEDNELDYSGSMVSGMSAATVTFTELPADTVEIHAYVQMDDVGTGPAFVWQRTEGGTQPLRLSWTFADQGTNGWHTLAWMPTGGNSIHVTTVVGGSASNFIIIGYKTGA